MFAKDGVVSGGSESPDFSIRWQAVASTTACCGWARDGKRLQLEWRTDGEQGAGGRMVQGQWVSV